MIVLHVEYSEIIKLVFIIITVCVHKFPFFESKVFTLRGSFRKVYIIRHPLPPKDNSQLAFSISENIKSTDYRHND